MIRRNDNKGITIVEIMVVVVIIGILATLSINRYRSAILRSKISEAVITVKHLQELEEAYYVHYGVLPHQDGTLLLLADGSRNSHSSNNGSGNNGNGNGNSGNGNGNGNNGNGNGNGGSNAYDDWLNSIHQKSRDRLDELGAEPLAGNSRFWYYFAWWDGGSATKIIYAYPKQTSGLISFDESECDKSLEEIMVAIDNDGSVYVWGAPGFEFMN